MTYQNCEVVQYKGRMFKFLLPGMITHLAEVYADEVNDRMVKNGIGASPGGMRGCIYCNWHNYNIARALASAKPYTPIFINGDPGISNVDGCGYRRKIDVEWATPFRNNETGAIYIARKTPCAIYDSVIEQLAERGALSSWEIPAHMLPMMPRFDFPTVAELDKDPKLQKKYLIKAGKGTLRRIFENIGILSSD